MKQNKWYDLETDFNFGNKTYDITVIDEAGMKSVTENVPFRNAGMRQYRPYKVTMLG